MHRATLFVGVGSPHGDDCAGWLVADALSDIAATRKSAPMDGAPLPCGHVAIHKIGIPADLFDRLDDAAELVVCDAIRGAGPVGTLHRWSWPDARISQARPAGSHDLGLSDVLALAGRLGRLPASVIVWGIEAGPVVPDGSVSPEIRQALPNLIERIWCELSHA